MGELVPTDLMLNHCNEWKEFGPAQHFTGSVPRLIDKLCVVRKKWIGGFLL